jgi:hypothetical protein
MIESLLKSLLNGYFESQKNFPEKHHRGQKFKTSQLLDIAKDCLCTKMPHQLLRTYPSTMCLTKKWTPTGFYPYPSLCVFHMGLRIPTPCSMPTKHMALKHSSDNCMYPRCMSDSLPLNICYYNATSSNKFGQLVAMLAWCKLYIIIEESEKWLHQDVRHLTSGIKSQYPCHNYLLANRCKSDWLTYYIRPNNRRLSTNYTRRVAVQIQS